MASGDSRVEKIQSNFQKLSAVASSLNSASDELTKVVSVLDDAIRSLNIGLTVWIDFNSHVAEAPEYDNDQIGYCKLNGKWGIALQRVWGDYQSDYYQSDGPWLFNDAPRDMRLKSVDKIPDLIEKLGKEALETTKNVHEKTQSVRELADAIAQITNPEKQTTKTAPPPYIKQQDPPAQRPPYQKQPDPPAPYKKAPYKKALDPTPEDNRAVDPTPRANPFEQTPGTVSLHDLMQGKTEGSK
jgi:hypothetical protein